jgi:hypothetical protein
MWTVEQVRDWHLRHVDRGRCPPLAHQAIHPQSVTNTDQAPTPPYVNNLHSIEPTLFNLKSTFSR